MHDRIGEAIPEQTARTAFLNPKNCEFGNASFLGIRKDGVLLFSIDGREERIREVCEDILSKASLASIEDDLIRFSRLQTKSDFAEYASEHGPLFGGTYLRENGIIEEPLSMLEASRIVLRARIQAQGGHRRRLMERKRLLGWEGSYIRLFDFLRQRAGSRGCEEAASDSQGNGRGYFLASVVLPCAINPDYARFTMTEEEIQKRVYCSGRWDEPEPR